MLPSSAVRACPTFDDSHRRPQGVRLHGGPIRALALAFLLGAAGIAAAAERCVTAETDSPIPSIESVTWGLDAAASDDGSHRSSTPAAGNRDIGVWTGRGPWGGNVRAFAVSSTDPMHVLCAAGLSQATESGGIWVSPDGGLTWLDTDLQNIPVYGVTGSGSEPGVFYASAYRGLHRSTDGGMSWAVIAYSTNFVLGAGVKVDDGNVILAGLSSDQGIRRSTDGGATWNPVGLSTGFFKGFGTSPLDPSRMYLAISSEPSACYRSTDGGASWTGVGPAGSSGYGIWVDPADPDRVFLTVAVDGTPGIYRTLDGGLSWIRVLSGTSYAPVTEQGGALFAAIIGQGIYRSTDGGGTWSLHSGGIVSSFWQASTTSTVAPLFGHWGGIYRWNEAGSDWVVSQTGLNNAYVRTVAFYHDTQTLWAGADQSGLWRSTDLGLTWEMVTAGLSTWTLYDLVPQDHLRYGNPRMALATDNGLFISDDAGDTWAAAGQQGQVLTDAAIDWTDPDLLWAGLSTGGVRRSTDGGASWLNSAGIPAGLYPDLELADGPSGPRVLASFQELMGGTPAVHYSDDGGANFTAGSAGLSGVANLPGLCVRRGAPGAGGLIYCSTSAGIYRSSDAGVNWTHAGTLTGICWSVLGSLSANAFAGRQGQGAYWSEAEGEGWVPFNSGIETATAWAMVHGFNGNWAFAGLRGRGVKQVELESGAVAGPAPDGISSACPNPFSGSTRITFDAPRAEEATLRVFDAAGRPVAHERIRTTPGAQTYEWNGRSDRGPLPDGVYFYRIDGTEQIAAGRCVLLRR